MATIQRYRLEPIGARGNAIFITMRKRFFSVDMSTIRRRYRLLSYRRSGASNLLAGNIGRHPAEWVARPSKPNNKSYPQPVEKMLITLASYPQGTPPRSPCPPPATLPTRQTRPLAQSPPRTKNQPGGVELRGLPISTPQKNISTKVKYVRICPHIICELRHIVKVFFRKTENTVFFPPYI